MTDSLSIYDTEPPKIVPGTYGEVEIRLIQNDTAYVLERSGIPWMCTDVSFSACRDSLYSQYDLAYGDVLITGLGFGILLKALSQKPEVSSVTVVEIEDEVINAFLANNTINSKVSIVSGNASTYISDQKYDCLLPDHYETQTMEWRIKDMNNIANRIEHDVFWPWSIEEIFLEKTYPRYHYDTPGKEKVLHTLESVMAEDPGILHGKWKAFIDKDFSSNQSLLSIDPTKLSIYVQKYAKDYYATIPTNLY
jgi:hypothetical protein